MKKSNIIKFNTIISCNFQRKTSYFEQLQADSEMKLKQIYDPSSYCSLLVLAKTRHRPEFISKRK
jgi:hypothetical protein